MPRWMRKVTLGFVGLVLLIAGVGSVYQSIATSRDLARTPPPGRLVDVGGHRLHLWCQGSGSPAVILDSGLGGTAFDWYAVQPDVSSFTKVCAYDRAGMGYSDAGPRPRTSRQIARELAILLRTAQIEEPVILVGASFGGWNMRVFASEYTDRVAGLVLVDASHEDQGRRYAEAGLPAQIPASIRFVARIVPGAASLGILRLLSITLGPPPEAFPPPVSDFIRATAFRSTQVKAMASELLSTGTSGDQVRATRRELAIPVLVLSAGRGNGEYAEVNRDLQLDQLGLSARSCQVIAEQSGHVIASNQPGAVVDAIRATIAAAADRTSKPGC